MAWFGLIVSGMVEAVWATALGKWEGFCRLGPSIIFAVALIASMAGLGSAIRELPTATSCSPWVEFGGVLTTAHAMAFEGEPISLVKVLR